MTQSTVLRRRGRHGSAHPGRECGPCQLCGKTASYSSHPSTWDSEILAKLYQIEQSIKSDSCICRACEKHIKRNILSENYKPRWISNSESIKCIIPECLAQESIVHSGIATTQQILSAFNVTVSTEGKLVPDPL